MVFSDECSAMDLHTLRAQALRPIVARPHLTLALTNTQTLHTPLSQVGVGGVGSGACRTDSGGRGSST